MHGHDWHGKRPEMTPWRALWMRRDVVRYRYARSGRRIIRTSRSLAGPLKAPGANEES
jgi:hypothetical protein